jgi:hypothetical protein
MPTFTRLFGDGKHGRASRIQIFRCQACRTTFRARRHTPLSRLKTPSHQVAMVLTARAFGLDPSEAWRVFGFRQATITSLSHSRRSARSDVAQSLLSHSAYPIPPVGRTAHQTSELQSGVVALADNRPSHEDYTRTPSGSSHAKHGASSHSLPTTGPGS